VGGGVRARDGVAAGPRRVHQLAGGRLRHGVRAGAVRAVRVGACARGARAHRLVVPAADGRRDRRPWCLCHVVDRQRHRPAGGQVLPRRGRPGHDGAGLLERAGVSVEPVGGELVSAGREAAFGRGELGDLVSFHSMRGSFHGWRGWWIGNGSLLTC